MRRKRMAVWTALALVVGALSVVAAGCGGGDDGSSASAEIEGLGSTLDEIKANAKTEGKVDLVAWAYYVEDGSNDPKADWVTDFEKDTGCDVSAKVASTSDEMVTLMKTGQYDGVSASGNASLRLVAGGDVAPVNLDLVPNYADIFEDLKGQPYNTVDGVPYGIPHGRGANVLMWRTDIVKPAPDSWSVVFDPNSPYKGKVTAYDDSVYIADAAVYLMATQPDLNITNPYELDDTQFQAAVDLLKQQKAIIGEYWADYAKEEASFTSGDSVVGTTWQSVTNFLKGEKVPVESTSPKEGVNRMVGHVDDQLQGRPSQLHVPLDGPHRQPADECDPDGVLRRGARRIPSRALSCLTRRSASSTTQTIRRTGRTSTTGSRPSRTAATTAVRSARTTASGSRRGPRSGVVELDR